ncbi:MAG: N-acetylmuramoyl-L-alanine amidase [Candidatus Zixiibacteriota bacterium]
MKGTRTKLILYFLFVLAIFNLVEAKTKSRPLPEISVIYPEDGAKIHASDSTFIFGSVTPKSDLKINGAKVDVRPNGAFLAFLPLKPGDFVFTLQAKSKAGSSTKKVKVKVPQPAITIPRDGFYIVKSSILPKEDLTLTIGDVLETKFRGTPDCLASFSVEGVVEDVPMIESTGAEEDYQGEDEESKPPAVKGIYTGAYIIRSLDKAKPAKIIFKLKKKTGRDGLPIAESAAGRITIEDERIPQVVEFVGSPVIARSGPRMGYTLLNQPPGVRAVATGRKGEWVRLRLAYGENAWVHQDSIKFLPLGTPIPKNSVTTIQTIKLERKTRVELLLSSGPGKLPFRVEQQVEPPALFLTVYGLTSNTDWIRYDSADSLIKEITWDQPKDQVYELKIFLSQKQQWGYNVFYEGDNLIMEIKHTPNLTENLKGLKICLDPGHSPDPGAVGPTGLPEEAVNLKIAQKLKALLEQNGAEVVMTRSGNNDGLALYDRPKLAVHKGCDVLISIHNNALPDGMNPFYNNGTATYYYHPQSLPLARCIQSRLLKNLNLPDYGTYYGNLALTRSNQLLAVLVECAFMMIPEQEELLGTEKFQGQCAEAICQGLLDFVDNVKK